MNYRNVYRALSVKNAYAVLKEVYQGVVENNPRSFDDLKEKLKMNKFSLRRITNRLSSCDLITAMKSTYLSDGRKRVFIISDKFLLDKIFEITDYMKK